MAKESKEKVIEEKFSKSQLVEYKEFVKDVDIINAILDEDKEYSIKEARNIIDKFKKKEVE